jgi:colanic acid/amylovoran biosynthesis glycosyltransferase
MSEHDAVTYLVTQIPAVSHTFIADEIVQLERRGRQVRTVSINPPKSIDVRNPDDLVWVRRTLCIKLIPRLRASITVLRHILRHPSLLWLPLRLGGFDVKRYVWRFFYLAEAILVADAMHGWGSHHVHAHYGQSPASVAWFTSEVGNRCFAGDTPWTWSLTIHGWHEFVNEDSANLKEKLAAASFVVAISDYTRSQLFRIADPEHWHKISVVRCGIDLTRFTRRTQPSVSSPARLLLVARVSREKGHLVAIQALELLRERGMNVVLDLVGPAQDGFEASVRDEIVRLGLQDAVVWHGPATPEQIADHLDRADVFCLPTFAEGLPIVIMEAMARGVPVATTYISGIPELAIDHETAVVVPAGRPDLLADGLQHVLDDIGFRDALVAKAAARVADEHDITKNSPQLAAIFEAHLAAKTRCASR